MKEGKENIILNKTFAFSLQIIAYVELLEERKKFVIANQLLKSATSIGANVRETQHAESLQDFIHKLKIAKKEAIETSYWLELCQAATHYPDCKELIVDAEDINKIISRIIISSKSKIQERVPCN